MYSSAQATTVKPNEAEQVPVPVPETVDKPNRQCFPTV
jgi:hypothetical protein